MLDIIKFIIKILDTVKRFRESWDMSSNKMNYFDVSDVFFSNQLIKNT